MASDVFALLELPPEADPRVVEAAYWAHARSLAAALRGDASAAARLDRLNDAYHAYSQSISQRGALRPRPKRSGRRKALVLGGAFLVAASAAATTAWLVRAEIRDAGARSEQAIEGAVDDAAEWLRSLGATPTPAAQFFIVANTGGEGAYIRVGPGYDTAGIVALRDGTGLVATGEEVTIAGETWLRVQDAQGRVGWISRRWVAPVG